MSSAKIGESLDSAAPQLDYLDLPAGPQALVPNDEQDAKPDRPERGGGELIDMPRRVL